MIIEIENAHLPLAAGATETDTQRGSEFSSSSAPSRTPRWKPTSSRTRCPGCGWKRPLPTSQ
eukprot:1552292-Pyramimonas_sp.AAC.1